MYVTIRRRGDWDLNHFKNNKKLANVVYGIIIFIELFINYLMNKISQEEFSFFSERNIFWFVILILTTVIYICFKIMLRKDDPKDKQKKLQKAFQDNGVYDAFAKETKLCIEKHDYKNVKLLKKMMDYIDK